jgi:hypothetical protein
MKTTIDMAREAGFGNYSYEAKKIFEIFEALVRADEREACAKVCEDQYKGYGGNLIALAIRNRGNT